MSDSDKPIFRTRKTAENVDFGARPAPAAPLRLLTLATTLFDPPAAQGYARIVVSAMVPRCDSSTGSLRRYGGTRFHFRYKHLGQFPGNAEMSLSGNRGALMAGYPSVERVLGEFERALALEPAERTQQLSASFQQCIRKSMSEPPACQCGF